MQFKRPRSVHRIVVARRQRAQRGETRHAHRRDGRLSAAANHGLRVSALNNPEAVADGVSAGGTGSRRRRVGSFGVVPDGNLARGQIYDRRGNKEGRDTAGAVFQKLLVLALDGPEIADPAADISAHVLSDFISDLEPAVFDRFLRSGDGVLDEGAHLARFLLLDVVQRIKVFDFAGEPNGKLFSVKFFDVIRAAVAFLQRGPGRLD